MGCSDRVVLADYFVAAPLTAATRLLLSMMDVAEAFRQAMVAWVNSDRSASHVWWVYSPGHNLSVVSYRGNFNLRSCKRKGCSRPSGGTEVSYMNMLVLETCFIQRIFMSTTCSFERFRVWNPPREIEPIGATSGVDRCGNAKQTSSIQGLISGCGCQASGG